MAGLANKYCMEEHILKTLHLIVAIVALTAFAFAGVAIATGTFYVTKDTAGNMVVVDKAPADAGAIVKGPFKSLEEAKKALEVAKEAIK
jgi:hypothetical protein